MIMVCVRIIFDTRSVSKTLAYLLFVFFLPVIGIVFYFSFGINYRKRKMYSKKLLLDDTLRARLKNDIFRYSQSILYAAEPGIQYNRELAVLLLKDIVSPLTANNDVKILVNGENKFPEVLQAIAEAKDHIHIEY